MDDPGSLALKLAAVIGLVALNGFFVATEFSLVSVRRSRMESLVAAGNRRARTVLDALKNLDAYIAATQLGITISSIGLGWIGEPALAAILDPMLERVLPDGVAFVSAHAISFAIAFTIITTLHVVLGELAPKSVALQYAEATSMVVAAPTRAFMLVFRPVIAVMNGMGLGLLRLIGVPQADVHDQIYTEEELRLIIAASGEKGELVQFEEEVIHRAFVFHDQTVGEVMTPRTELIMLPSTASIDDLRRLVVEHPHHRFPVFEQNQDRIVGILQVRDLLPVLLGTDARQRLPLIELVRPVLAVPESSALDETLEQMNQAGTRAAIVIDEYGGTAGMVTMTDILRRLIETLPDDSHETTAWETRGEDGWVRISGLRSLQDVGERFGLEFDQQVDVNSIGGYIFALIGRRPAVGDIVQVDGYEARVERLDGLRIAEVSFRERESAEALQTEEHPGHDT